MGVRVRLENVFSETRPIGVADRNDIAKLACDLPHDLRCCDAGAAYLGDRAAQGAGRQHTPMRVAIVGESRSVGGRRCESDRDGKSHTAGYRLRVLSDFFEVDTSFLRRNDFDRKMTVLAAEWPPRENVPDPDPLGEVPLGADPVFDATFDLKQPFVMRPAGSPDAYAGSSRSRYANDGF